MKNAKILFYNEKVIDKINILLISILPLTLISRSALINIFSAMIAIFFIFKIIKEKENKFLKDKVFYLLIFFWSSLIINLFFTTDFNSSFFRAAGFGKFILIVFAIKYYLNFKNYKFENFIYFIWFLIFAIVSFDLFFEFLYGHNLIGYQSYIPGRLSGFLNEELKIGHYYYAFILISLCFFYKNNKNYITFLTLSFLFIFISFAIGERSNFLKAIIIFCIFFFTYEKKKIFTKFFLLLTFLTIIIFTTIKNESYKIRLWGQFLKPITETVNITDYISKSHYGAHYDTAIKIFYNYPFFGAGLKNYRNESIKEIYYSGDKSVDTRRWATHPHQIHFEFLSETGIFGYSSFLIFVIISLILSIRSYLKNKNIYQLSAILFIIVSCLPLLPSGSFFTTYGATIFWINFGVMIAYNEK